MALRDLLKEVATGSSSEELSGALLSSEGVGDLRFSKFTCVFPGDVFQELIR